MRARYVAASGVGAAPRWRYVGAGEVGGKPTGSIGACGVGERPSGWGHRSPVTNAARPTYQPAPLTRRRGALARNLIGCVVCNVAVFYCMHN
ncbi:hypothetical protein E2562_021189 [Oryza meyeriana var. granulata]|uniref:Uncharacterized protein n=1 Tax=Oryza meyeriana var. granulata TaxID=110450 RepID=A0A6G1DZ54_9ORYZ|nr:hypothetical protein E2562_021189 [Oryza meyeriana var. granulata]